MIALDRAGMRLIAKLLKFFANRVRRQGGNPIGEGGGAGGRYSFGSSIGTRRKSNIFDRNIIIGAPELIIGARHMRSE
jgi:hypothetical protein